MTWQNLNFNWNISSNTFKPSSIEEIKVKIENSEVALDCCKRCDTPWKLSSSRDFKFCSTCGIRCEEQNNG